MNIRCGNCQGRHETVAEVKRCFGVDDRAFQDTLVPNHGSSVFASSNYPTATDAQANFIRSLLSDREIPPHLGEWADNIRKTLGDDAGQRRTIGKRDASQVITILSNKENFPVKPRTAVQVGVAARPSRPTADGMYRNPATGEIFKLQWNRASGDGRRLYAKQLIVNADGERLTAIPLASDAPKYKFVSAEFVYTAGAIAKVRPEWLMSMEEARQFGALYGTCVRCGRTLTAEDSIERMMGPVCAGKGNWA